jgi:hypothetical protein
VSAFLAYQVKALAFISVWCFFAALLSFIVYRYFQHNRREVPARAMSW